MMEQIIPLLDWNRGKVLGGDYTIPLLGGVRGGFPFPVFTRTRVVKSQ